MKKLATNRNLLILALIILGIYIWYKYFRTPSPSTSGAVTPNNSIPYNQNISNTTTTGQGTPTTSTSNTTPAVPVSLSDAIGKVAYAKTDGVTVYQNACVPDGIVYKIAAQNEWIGVINNDMCPGFGKPGNYWIVSGNKSVLKSQVYIQ